jgi:2,3-bisphosphoglycerate-independent phosphoglycerate mutase
LIKDVTMPKPLHLTSLKHFKGRPGPIVLIIMDGVGLGEKNAANAVHLANTPCLDALMTSSLYTELKAHGTSVGMPTDEDMGNSEVGHNTLGAGRIFEQGASLVKKALKTESLFKGSTWRNAVGNTLEKHTSLHFIGLLSDGNVHSHIDHLKQMISKAVSEGQKKIRLHTLLDGRDVGQKTALTYIENLENHILPLNTAGADIKIASGGGRMVTTMDRYNADWSIVERGWRAHVLGLGEKEARSASEAVQFFYDSDPSLTDQYMPSFVVVDDKGPIGTIEDGDTVIITNFRGDRVMELSLAFESDNFDTFDRHRVPDIYLAGMMQYDGDLHIPKNFLVDPPTIKNAISHYLCAMNISAFAISETQKYGHVTYFWNGNKSGYVNEQLETFIEIPSDIIPFDQKPDMKAKEITEKVIELLESGTYKFGRINFPNGDMVGHTGNLEATIKSVEITDICVQKIIDTVNRLNGVTIVIADHGNADDMFSEKDGIKTPKTAHTLNPVPCAIVDSQYDHEYDLAKLDTSGLANIASTLCNLLGYEAPSDYEPSLIKFS